MVRSRNSALSAELAMHEQADASAAVRPITELVKCPLADVLTARRTCWRCCQVERVWASESQAGRLWASQQPVWGGAVGPGASALQVAQLGPGDVPPVQLPPWVQPPSEREAVWTQCATVATFLVVQESVSQHFPSYVDPSR
jgi:hypothetical protein